MGVADRGHPHGSGGMTTVLTYCYHCQRMHQGACSEEQRRADDAENAHMRVAASFFARWASAYLVSLASLAHAGVRLEDGRR
jgi:phenylpropionate dioxygenase-like ring-hydroxylating dioxygenase large terminal subunit